MLIILAAATAIACPHPRIEDARTFRCGGDIFRIENIDAPQLPGSAACRQLRVRPAWCSAKAVAKASEELARLLSHGRIEVRRIGRDTEGRILARVTVNGRDAGEYLIRRGAARPWS